MRMKVYFATVPGVTKMVRHSFWHSSASRLHLVREKCTAMSDTTKRTAALNEKFAIGNHLRFEETPEGLTKIVIATPKVSAQMYTQGAHLTQWDVAGHKPGLFVSGRSEFAVGKPIRGGVPV